MQNRTLPVRGHAVRLTLSSAHGVSEAPKLSLTLCFPCFPADTDTGLFERVSHDNLKRGTLKTLGTKGFLLDDLILSLDKEQINITYLLPDRLVSLLSGSGVVHVLVVGEIGPRRIAEDCGGAWRMVCSTVLRFLVTIVPLGNADDRGGSRRSFLLKSSNKRVSFEVL